MDFYLVRFAARFITHFVDTDRSMAAKRKATAKAKLKNKSKEKGFNFLDVHKLTDRGDGISNTIWHIDDTHLSPEGFLEAWNRYVPEQKPV